MALVAARGCWASAWRLCGAGLLAVASSTAGAQAELPPCPPAEQVAVRSYVPTAAKLKAFTDAAAAAFAAAAHDPALAAMFNKQDRAGECTNDANETGLSFVGARAMMTKSPRLGSIYAAQGIGARELVIWSKLAVLFAFASQPQFAAAAAGELSPAQQDFVRDNKARIERLMKALASSKKAGPW